MYRKKFSVLFITVSSKPGNKFHVNVNISKSFISHLPILYVSDKLEKQNQESLI